MSSEVREKSQALLTSTLEALGNQASNQAITLESAIFDKYNGDTGNIYRNDIRQLSLDLGKSNRILGEKVANGSISAQEVVEMSKEQLKSSKRAAEDDEIREQGLRDSVGVNKIPMTEPGARSAGSTTAKDDLSQEGEVGMHEASMGGDGEFKARAQLKIAGLEGIEFDTGD